MWSLSFTFTATGHISFFVLTEQLATADSLFLLLSDCLVTSDYREPSHILRN